MGPAPPAEYLGVPLRRDATLTGTPRQGGGMTANRSLDEFAAASSEEAPPEAPGARATTADDQEAPAGPAADAGSEIDADSATDEAVEPVESTYHWTPGGGPCGTCGETVEERWRQGEELVCPACKEW